MSTIHIPVGTTISEICESFTKASVANSGLPSADNNRRVYTREECEDVEHGIWHANGECTDIPEPATIANANANAKAKANANAAAAANANAKAATNANAKAATNANAKAATNAATNANTNAKLAANTIAAANVYKAKAAANANANAKAAANANAKAAANANANAKAAANANAKAAANAVIPTGEVITATVPANYIEHLGPDPATTAKPMVFDPPVNNQLLRYYINPKDITGSLQDTNIIGWPVIVQGTDSTEKAGYLKKDQVFKTKVSFFSKAYSITDSANVKFYPYEFDPAPPPLIDNHRYKFFFAPTATGGAKRSKRATKRSRGGKKSSKKTRVSKARRRR